MDANPNTFDYILNGEPLQYLSGTASTTGFEYVNQGEPFQALIVVSAPAPTTGIMTPIGKYWGML